MVDPVYSKRGKIDDTLPPILKRLNIDASTWQDIALNFEITFGPWASSEQLHRRPRLRAGSGEKENPQQIKPRAAKAQQPRSPATQSNRFYSDTIPYIPTNNRATNKKEAAI